jgi:hypothetical protein
MGRIQGGNDRQDTAHRRACPEAIWLAAQRPFLTFASIFVYEFVYKFFLQCHQFTIRTQPVTDRRSPGGTPAPSHEKQEQHRGATWFLPR